MRFTIRLFVGPMLAVFLFGCDAGNKPQPAADYDDSPKADAKTPSPQPSAPATAKTAAQAPPVAPFAKAPAPSVTGTVIETMDAASYTYMLLKTEAGDVWAAAPKTVMAVGDMVELYAAMPMKDFPSKTLNRTFKDILFASQAVVRKSGSGAAQAPKAAAPKIDPAAQMPADHPPVAGAPADAGIAGHSKPKAGPVTVKAGDIEKLDGGYTVAELFADKADLVDKPVKIRARVVKATRGIMGKNWMHIQDGTGEAGSNDVTVTSVKEFAPVGTIIVVEGTLQADKNIGAGYVFAVLIEATKVTAEPSKAAKAD